jgi:hypothetical protein
MLLRTIFLAATLAGYLSAGYLPAATHSDDEQSITCKMTTITKALPGCQAKPSPLKCASVQLTYPTILSAPSATGKAEINRQLEDMLLTPIEKGKPPATADEFASQILNHYRVWLKHGGSAKIPWDVQRKIDVVYQSANVFSVKLFESVEQGTQHPAQNTVYFNFRPDTGHLVQLTDLIAADDMDKFAAVINKHLKKRAKKSPEGEDTKEPGQEFELPKNFSIERDGLRFRYEEGQVNPESDTVPEFLVRYSEIKKMLRPDAKVP